MNEHEVIRCPYCEGEFEPDTTDQPSRRTPEYQAKIGLHDELVEALETCREFIMDNEGWIDDRGVNGDESCFIFSNEIL